MRRAAIIPARGGSKRIPRKNIKSFAGKPMLAYAIAAAKQSELFDCIAVSSDDDEILSVATDLGAISIRRPASLADDYTPTVPVIAHAAGVLGDRFVEDDVLCCIYPAVPFLQPQDLSSAMVALDDLADAYVFPVVSFPSPIQRALKREASGRLASFSPEFAQVRTQDLEAAYHDAGQFYCGRLRTWVANHSIHANGYGIVIPEWRAVDIDTPADWHHAELMHRVLQADGLLS